MKRLLCLSVMCLVVTVGVPAVSAAVPAEDSVIGDGVIDFSGEPGGLTIFTEVIVDARSGPSGEAPSGDAFLGLCGSNTNSRLCFPNGPVTCLNVTGNRAVFAFDGGHFNSSDGVIRIRVLVEVVDNGSPGAGSDTLQIVFDNLFLSGPPSTRPPDVPITDCPESLPGDGTPLFAGDTFDYDFPQDYVVTDAKPLPTSKDQCKNGGWRTYGVFKNQGDCVSFVATKGKNKPTNSP